MFTAILILVLEVLCWFFGFHFGIKASNMRPMWKLRAEEAFLKVQFIAKSMCMYPLAMCIFYFLQPKLSSNFWVMDAYLLAAFNVIAFIVSVIALIIRGTQYSKMKKQNCLA